jgi:hypothetical protein
MIKLSSGGTRHTRIAEENADKLELGAHLNVIYGG